MDSDPPAFGSSSRGPYKSRHDSNDTTTTAFDWGSVEEILSDSDAFSQYSSRPSISPSQMHLGRASDEVHVSVASPHVVPTASIDACTFSPDSKHVAIYSARAGRIAIWLVDDLLRNTNAKPTWESKLRSTQLHPREYWVSRPSFTPSFIQGRLMTNVDFALSNQGNYVALSAIKLPQDLDNPEPFMLVHPPPDTGNKFFTFVVKTLRDRPICRRKLVRLKGPIKFLSDGRSFVVCDIECDEYEDRENYIYVWSTVAWQVLRKIVLDRFTMDLQEIPHPWTQIGVLKNVVTDGFFISVEQWNVASLWSLHTAQLVTRFKCLPGDTFLDADSSPALFALSNDKQMMASWTSKGILTIFLCEGGIVFSSSKLNEDSFGYGSSIKKEIMWVEGDEHVITVNAVGSDHQRVEIWDSYSCRMIYTQGNMSQTCEFSPNGSGVYASFREDMPILHMVNTPRRAIANPSKISLSEKEIIGQHHLLEGGFIKVFDYNQKILYESRPGYERETGMSNDHPFVEHRVEPWDIFTPAKSIFILDERKERVLYIGRYTVQVWIFQCSKKPQLQYIWCRPMKSKGAHWRRTMYATIERATLRRIQDGRYLLEIHAQISPQDKRSFSKLSAHTNDFLFRDHLSKISKVRKYVSRGSPVRLGNEDCECNLTIPLEDDNATFDIVGSAAYALGFLTSAERKHRIRFSAQKINEHYNHLLDQTREIILNAIHNSAHIFNEIRDSQSCVEILIKADCKHADAMIEELLKSNKHIPRFHDAARQKSALRRAISVGKTEVVRALLEYYVRRSEENPVSWMSTVVPALPALTRMYPDIAIDLMKSISYHLSGEDIVRSNNNELYAFSKVEDRDAEKTLFERIRMWLRQSEHKLDHVIAHDILQLPDRTHPAIECVVPLPDFTVYRPFPAHYAKKISQNSWWPWAREMIETLRWRPERSVFVKEVLIDRIELFDTPAMEAIINFKWRKFGRTRFFFLLMLNMLYSGVFLTGVSSQSLLVRNAMIPAIMIIGVGFLLLQLLIMTSQPDHYWYSPYNWVELAATVLPMIFAGFGASQTEKFSVLIGSSMFFVYMNLILQLRVFKPVGVPTFIIFEIFRNVFWFNCLVGAMVLAFAHIFTILLKDSPDPNLSTWNSYGEAVISVYFFLTGSFDSIQDALNQPIIAILVLTYSIFTAIVLLNVLIALMTDVVSQTDGKRAWLRQKAEVIAKVEMYLLSQSQRKRKDFFPSLIFYYASPDQIRKYKEKLNEEKAKQKVHDSQCLHLNETKKTTREANASTSHAHTSFSDDGESVQGQVYKL